MPLITDTTLNPGEEDAKPEKADRRFHSVTTIIGALDKPALVYWAANTTAETAVAWASSLSRRIKEQGSAAVRKSLADSRFNPPPGADLSATALGSAVHAACEQYALTGVMPEVVDEAKPFLVQFDKWCQKWQPEYVAAEAPVYSTDYAYAGTLDAIVKVAGGTFVFDYKTSRKSVDDKGKPTKPYPEVALQLAAYRHANFMATWRARRYEHYRRRYYLLSDVEEGMGAPLPDVDGALALHITPEHADMYPVRADAEVFTAFLHVIEAFRWVQDLSKTAIGDPYRLDERA